MIRTPARTSGVKRAKTTTVVTTTKKKPYPVKDAILRSPKFTFPRMYSCPMTYAEVTTKALTAGLFNWHFMCANGIYDANQTGTGTQPLYFDQLSSIYGFYAVTSSRIELTVSGPSTSNNNLIAVVYEDDDTAGAANTASAMQRPGAVYRMWNSNQETMPGGPLKLSFSAANTFGNPRPWTDPQLSGIGASNPAQETFFVFTLEDKTLQTTTFTFSFKIVYQVVWYELKTIGES